MTWTSPPTVATGDLLTAAMWNTYVRDNPNHLRGLTGTGDPGAANRLLVSSGAAFNQVAWTTVPSAALTDPKVDGVTPNYYTSFGNCFANARSGFFEVSTGIDGPAGSTSYYCYQIVDHNFPATFGMQITCALLQAEKIYSRIISSGTPSAWRTIWNDGNDGTGSGLDAGLLAGLLAGNSSGNVPISNGVLSVNLNANILQGFTPGNGSGQLAINNTALNIGLNADQVDSHHAVDITPNNLRGWFNSVAELTAAGSHWSRDTAADGRLIIGADEEGNDAGLAVFTPGSNYGTSWFPSSALGATAGTLDVAGSVDAVASTPVYQSGVGINGPVIGHNHGSGGLSITGAPALTGTSLPWLPLMRSGVWGKKS